MLNKPIHFAPYLKSVIWGGERIAPYKGITTDQTAIGESWELSAVPGNVSVVDRGPLAGQSLTQLIETYREELTGADIYSRFGTAFPLLIKFIDAKADLSVQVHPDDELAARRHNCPGKTEMWHIIDTEPEAKIYVGLKESITPDDYERRVADNTVMEVIDAYDSAPGDTFFLPAGRIHAIGAGNLLAEIQETSDITYRIYDYDRRDKDGNPRELHTAQARDAIDYTVYTDYKSHPEGSVLADCCHFVTRKFAVDGSGEVAIPRDRESFTIIICLEGETVVSWTDGAGVRGSQKIVRGETWLCPAVLRDLAVSGKGEILSVQA